MAEPNLSQIQTVLEKWHEHNFPGVPSYQPLLGIGEEVGELMHAHLKGEQSIRHSPQEIREMKIDAVGDMLIFLLHYCNIEAINIQVALETTLSQVLQRDWKAYPKNGRTE